MGTARITYCSTEFLPCTYIEPKTVILCLRDPDLIVPTVCASPSVLESTYPFSTIEATICSFYTLDSGCQRKVYHYTFEYDDELLPVPSTTLITEDITGVFCKDCLTTWVEQKVGNDVTLVDNGDGTITLTNQHGCEYTVSAEGGVCVPFTPIITGRDPLNNPLDLNATIYYGKAIDSRGKIDFSLHFGYENTPVGLHEILIIIPDTFPTPIHYGSSVHALNARDASPFPNATTGWSYFIPPIVPDTSLGPQGGLKLVQLDDPATTHEWLLTGSYWYCE